MLLAVGGRLWIRRLFAATLHTLAAELDDARHRIANRGGTSGALLDRFRLGRELAPFDPA